MHLLDELEELDVDLFRATTSWQPPFTQRIYGGQVIGQALVAASKTVDEQFSPHSLHSYFLRHGDPSIPVIYKVERTRNGRSYCSRNVYAIQRGLTIYTSQISFSKFEKSVIEHQNDMPNAPDPESLPTTKERLQGYLERGVRGDRNRSAIEKAIASEIPLDIRPCDRKRIGFFDPDFESKAPYQLVWIKTVDKIGPGFEKLHQCIAGYASDYSLLQTARLPHPKFRVNFASSLDHSMWFHLPFRADEWMLYELESPKANNGRALVFGKLFTQDGRLAVTVAQEGVLRGVIKDHPSRL
ncbi:uncharacterized protein TRIADDRAFT_50197 [Trichoplax adhaerens]|uniref:Acyl-coenzyme A thioesterase 8 n=1 Tax=Trichoplax adhaerens TaxID=10228 RepID=B3RVE3_TRIAD|nr:hypothetical protein TRIADDRAFT_50197 [Trichoplax adhaerens]EDV25979.1 hypothetical protein TRIADDRAFT_50197 [Trichoplax adhaerens]|eukprot:XP_002112012.1 hypothetical protein TRIADDRAFT_50197 [Trichoplax adhaerens]